MNFLLRFRLNINANIAKPRNYRARHHKIIIWKSGDDKQVNGLRRRSGSDIAYEQLQVSHFSGNISNRN